MRYRGRLAPSPTGYLHLGHARTFLIAQQRARQASGELLLRNDDLDAQRSRPEYVQAMIEDLHWLGIAWHGAIITQSERLPLYRQAFEALKAAGAVYPCTCSRKDLQSMVRAPHPADDDEPLYPGICRTRTEQPGREVAWRYRVPEGQSICFQDGNFGEQAFQAGKHFGDFLVWRRDGLPSYQLACVVDDAELGVTEVVRGSDLMLSTARQLLLISSLQLAIPAYYHCPLMLDETGERMAKRHGALSIRALRTAGHTPHEVCTAALAGGSSGQPSVWKR